MAAPNKRHAAIMSSQGWDWSVGSIANMGPSPQLTLGIRNVWGGESPASISISDRAFHTYVVGKSGSGKSTLLQNLILQEIALGHGVGVIDPHGDLATSVLDAIPPWRTDHLAYFNPGDVEHPVGFNPLANRSNPALAASMVVSALKHIWRDSWGPRLEYILYSSIAALLECPNTSFLGITRLLHDKAYRNWVVGQISDPMVRGFFVNEFNKYDPKFMREAVAPIQNKVGQLLMSPAVRNILGQVRNRIDFRFMLDGSRIFVANLSKGVIGEDKSNLLGSLLVSQFQLAALARSDVSAERRRPFSLFVDEYQNFCSDSFASILAEARKYGLSLTLAHQYLDQVPAPMQNAVFGNVGNLIVFQVGATDAERLAAEMGGNLQPQNLAQLDRHTAFVRSFENGVRGDPFLVRTLSSMNGRFQTRNRLIQRSRERFSAPRREIEGKIGQWLVGPLGQAIQRR